MKIHRIGTHGTGNDFRVPTGDMAFVIHLDGTENAEFKDVVSCWMDALELHQDRSKDYKKREMFSLGVQGEFVGFWRKAQKLHSEVWERTSKLVREGVQEVLMDCMGSVGLMLHESNKASDKYSARWRDNHHNKPTFGPGPADGVTVHGKAQLDALVIPKGTLQEGDRVHIPGTGPRTGSNEWMRERQGTWTSQENQEREQARLAEALRCPVADDGVHVRSHHGSGVCVHCTAIID